MSKRTIDSHIFTRQWFRKLAPAEKSAWLYLSTRCDAVGVWDADPELADFLIGEAVDWEGLPDKTGGAVVVLADGKWWLKDYCAEQYGPLNPRCRPHAAYIRQLEAHGLADKVEIVERVKPAKRAKKEAADTPSIPLGNPLPTLCQGIGNPNDSLSAPSETLSKPLPSPSEDAELAQIMAKGSRFGAGRPVEEVLSWRLSGHNGNGKGIAVLDRPKIAESPPMSRASVIESLQVLARAPALAHRPSSLLDLQEKDKDQEKDQEREREREEGGGVGGEGERPRASPDATLSTPTMPDLELQICPPSRASPRRPAKTQPAKHQHGEYHNVLLSDAELDKLIAKYGESKTTEAIEWFSGYLAEKNYPSKSHYLAMLRWVFAAVDERSRPRGEPIDYEALRDQRRAEMIRKINAKHFPATTGTGAPPK